jgi:adenine-specific DNA-methyltransferase
VSAFTGHGSREDPLRPAVSGFCFALRAPEGFRFLPQAGPSEKAALDLGSRACRLFRAPVKGRNGATIVNTATRPSFPIQLVNRLHHADCVTWMKALPNECVDFVLTDPPYMVRYRDRTGRQVHNDDNGAWLLPAFREIFRVLRPNRFLVSWYGWQKADMFLGVWRAAGFSPVGHFVAPKSYASSRRFTAAHHEQAYLLAKGSPALPDNPVCDLLPWRYTGNHWHPCEKPLCALFPLIDGFSSPGDVVLDPFAGSASTLIAAFQRNRSYCGVEFDERYYHPAADRLAREITPRRSSAA